MVDQKILDEFTPDSDALHRLYEKTDSSYESYYHLTMPDGRTYSPLRGTSYEDGLKHFLKALSTPGVTLEYDDVGVVFTGEDLLRVVVESFRPSALVAAGKAIGWGPGEVRLNPQTFAELQFGYEQGVFYLLDSLPACSVTGRSLAHAQKLAKVAWKEFPEETVSYLKANMPWWFANSKPGFTPSVKLTKKGKYPSGVFLVPGRTEDGLLETEEQNSLEDVLSKLIAPRESLLNSEFDTSPLLNSVLLKRLISKHSFFESDSGFLCFDAKKVPVGLFDGLEVTFIPSKDPRSAAAFLAEELKKPYASRVPSEVATAAAAAYAKSLKIKDSSAG